MLSLRLENSYASLLNGADQASACVQGKLWRARHPPQLVYSPLTAR